ncbi:MAG: hypothetical protein GY754_05220 [bacterium]|nr:hypothetical protein [bacterium]
MPDKDDIDFDSLFDDNEEAPDSSTENGGDSADEDLFSFDDDDASGFMEELSDIEELKGTEGIPESEKAPDIEKLPEIEESFKEPIPDAIPVPEKPAAAAPVPVEDDNSPKRSSQDFEPDMDALLITAQSSMVIEGTKYLTLRNYSSKAYPIYTEAINGIELYIKILQRNPNNYRKLGNIISQDIDCREVEKIAFNSYKAAYNDIPDTDAQKLKSFEIIKLKLKDAQAKAAISHFMIRTKKYFLLSGGLDEEKVQKLVNSSDPTLKEEVVKVGHHVHLAIDLLKEGKGELASGMKGKNMNIFIIKASQLLYYYYKLTNKPQPAGHFKNIHEHYKKYFVMR